MIFKNLSDTLIKINSLNISERKGEIKIPIPLGKIDYQGIEGDAHRGDHHRQISFLETRKIEEFKKGHSLHLNDGAFAENINFDLISNSTPNNFNFSVYDQISFLDGKIELSVTQIGKNCHNTSCAIKNKVGSCIMPTEGFFTRVLKTELSEENQAILKREMVGTIRKAYYKNAIIVMSDRAYQHIYQDESGPLCERFLKEKFQDKLHPTDIIVLPDEKEKLHLTLCSLIHQGGYDAIFVSGGTGVGPRDITYEVLNSFCDKEIFGIMEYIRNKYGELIPNARLSRSYAGIKDKTQIYGIPGSPKAVTDYMGEILKTYEHLISMILGEGH